MTPEPIYDLAHLGHLELLTPKPDESLKFFVDVMGMTISGRNGESVYLRGWDDYERYSLKLTASKTSGMEHMALRARSPQALERRVAALKGSGFDIGWFDGDMGQGPAFRCRDPDGHIIELYYETEWYEAPPELKPALKNQAQRFPARGVNVRRLDHLNCLAVDIKANRIFFEKYLGCRLTEQIVLDDGTEAAMWMTMSNKSYDFAYSHDRSNTRADSITSPTRSTAARKSCAPAGIAQDKAQLALKQARKDQLSAENRLDLAIRLHKDAVREHTEKWAQLAAGADARIAAVKSANELWQRLPGVAALGAGALYGLGFKLSNRKRSRRHTPRGSEEQSLSIRP
jgi:catechol 2,3-dioxygenase-like lactoylglutathione lyase family enzyme